jgi:beta-lactamase regulating signal transducer with metallopeptidase domain
MTEVLLLVLRVNVVVAAASLLVLAVRKPIRRRFGAHLAYGLWWIVPLAGLSAALPLARVIQREQSTLRPLWHGLAQLLARIEYVAPGVWLAGLLVGAGLLVLAQRAFARRERRGEAGPAIVGVLTPRLVMPAWLKSEFTTEERALIRAHERAHMDREDPRVNAAVTLAQLVFWFNPMVHVAAHYLRLDQELACDATVMARMPAVRRRYAETLLKTQLTTSPLPFGAQWLAHPLEERIGALKLAAPTPRQKDIGLAALATLSILMCGAAWAAQPAKIEEAAVRVVFLDLTPSLSVGR